MENRSYALMTGIFTLSLLFAAVLISLWLNRDRIERVPYQVATTRSVSGLSPQAPIRFRGLEVGRVKSISFDQSVPGQILIELNINPDAPITTSTYATLGFQGVTGIAFIQLNDDVMHPVRMNSSREKMARIELRASIFDKLESHGSLILTRAEQLSERLNNFLAPDNQKVILATFNQASKTAAAYEGIPQQLQPTLAKLPALTNQTEQALAALTGISKDAKILVTDMHGLVQQLQAPQGPLQTLTSTTRQLGGSVNQLLGQVEAQSLPKVNLLADEARNTMRNVNRSVNTLTEQPQSLLFGAPPLAPGPGEAGFVFPAAPAN
ncbi:MAG: hypothetical protein RL748_824 [Pseudomonadota bacterium]|jgi:phospholipid/cholesterol/gamma-HCH transport system substrate-binding protein